jgi:hypothetical protein
MEMSEFEALSGKVLAGEGETEDCARLKHALAEHPHYIVRYKEMAEAWEVVRKGGRFAPVKDLATPPFPQHRMAELIATVRAAQSSEATVPKQPVCALVQEIVGVLPLEIQELVRRWTDGTPSPRGTSFSKDDLLFLFSSSTVFGAAPVRTPAARPYWPGFGTVGMTAPPSGFLHAVFTVAENIYLRGRSRNIHTIYDQGRTLAFVNDEGGALMVVDRESKIIYFLRREKGGGIATASIPPSLSEVERRQLLEKELAKIR